MVIQLLFDTDLDMVIMFSREVDIAAEVDIVAVVFKDSVVVAYHS